MVMLFVYLPIFLIVTAYLDPGYPPKPNHLNSRSQYEQVRNM